MCVIKHQEFQRGGSYTARQALPLQFTEFDAVFLCGRCVSQERVQHTTVAPSSSHRDNLLQFGSIASWLLARGLRTPGLRMDPSWVKVPAIWEEPRAI